MEWAMGDAERQALFDLCGRVGVGTACGHPLAWVSERLSGWARRDEPDGYALFTPPGAAPDDLRVMYVSHIDEPGGYVGPAVGEDGAHAATLFGLSAEQVGGKPLQALDYLDSDGSSARPCTAEARRGKGPKSALFRFLGRRVHPRLGGPSGDRLLVRGEGLRPFGTVFTFASEARLEGEEIVAKALDPRVAVFAAVEALRRMERNDVGLLCFLAEETSVCPARKADRCLAALTGLRLVVTCDAVEAGGLVPPVSDRCVLRMMEKGDLMDPSVALRLRDALADDGPAPELAADSRASKTHLLASAHPTVSIGVPCHGIHRPDTRVKVETVRHAVEVLARAPGAVERGVLAT